MIVSKIIAGLCALVPVGCMALYLGYFADFSDNLDPLSASEMSDVSGCYKWGNYTIDAETSSLKFFRGKDLIIQSPATYQRERDVRVISDIQFGLDPSRMSIYAVHIPSSQTLIYTSKLFSKPYFIVFDPVPPNDKFVKFEKSAC